MSVCSKLRDFRYWPLADVFHRPADVCCLGQSGHHSPHPSPGCRTVAVTLPPEEDNAFIVNRTAATGVVKLP
jgi:hypothetical protein